MNLGGKPDKAFLTLMEPSATGGKSIIGEFRFQFNPNKFTVKKTARWVKTPAKAGKKATMSEFGGAEPRTMSVEIFLDATDIPPRNIAKDIALLFKCCQPHDPSLQKNRPAPPFVLFGWGSTMQFQAFVESVDVNYTLFKEDGRPLRAVATLALKEIPPEVEGQNPTSGSLAAQRIHTVVEGDSLASIAYAEYGDPTLWRAVARSNNIDDPMRLAIGARLLLPPAGEVAGVPS